MLELPNITQRVGKSETSVNTIPWFSCLRRGGGGGGGLSILQTIKQRPQAQSMSAQDTGHVPPCICENLAMVAGSLFSTNDGGFK